MRQGGLKGRGQVLWLRQRPHKGTRGAPRGTAEKRYAVCQAHMMVANGWRDAAAASCQCHEGGGGPTARPQRRPGWGCEQAKKEMAAADSSSRD